MILSKLLVLGVSLIVVSSGAMAAGKPPAHEEKVSLRNEAWTHGQDLSFAMDRVEKKWKASDAEFDDSLNDLQKSITKASTAEDAFAKAQLDLDNKKKLLEESVAANKAKIRELAGNNNGSANDLGQLAAEAKKLELSKRALDAEEEKLAKQAEARASAAEYAQKGLGEIRTKLSTQYGTMSESVKAQLTASSDVAGIKKVFGQEMALRKLQDNKNLIGDLFERLQGDYLESKMLFKDLELLKKDLKGSQELLDEVQAVASKKLDKTVMGVYVQAKIDAALGKVCALANKCGCSASAASAAISIAPVSVPKSVGEQGGNSMAAEIGRLEQKRQKIEAGQAK